MKLEPLAQPSLNPVAQTNTSPAQASARERAIQALLGQAPGQQQQQAPVANPTRVAPEEMGALRQSQQQSSSPAQSGQIDTSKDLSSEPAAAPEAPRTAEEQPLSSKYAEFARREKQIRQREHQLRAREAAFKAQDEAAKAPPKPTFDESKYVPKERLTADPFTVLNELGLSYDQLTELALNAPKPEQLAMMREMKALQAQVEALKGDTQKSLAQQQEDQRKQAMNQITSEVKRLVTSDPQFETVAATNSIQDVVELIERVFDKDGILLTVEEAALEVENDLVEEAMKIAKLKKIQQRLQSKETAPTASQKTTGQPQQQQLKTLTNSIASTRPLSARERAILAFENKLK